MKKLVVVAANHNAARFFMANDDGALLEFESLVCPESRMQGKDAYSDAPTQVQESVGSSHHMHQPKTSFKEKVSQQFVARICERMEQGRVENEVSGFVLVSPPDILGLIRQGLSDPCQKLVVGETQKNIANHDVETIYNALPAAIQGTFKKQGVHM